MKTLVMIPAFGCTEELYAPQIAALKREYRIKVIVPDNDRYDAMTDMVLAQSPEQFAILGTSMGGRVALEVAISAPERVTGLCVIGAAAGAVSDAQAGIRRSQRIRAGDLNAVISEMAENIAYLPGPRGEATRQAFLKMGVAFDAEKLARQSDALAHRIDRWDDLGAIEALTLCLWGAYDKFTPAADGQRLAEAVAMGSYIELPDCGHFPTLEYPDEATQAIALWLEDIDDVED